MNASEETRRVFGPFFGFDTSLAQCEVLAIARIPAPLLRLEADLYARKWFDYRPLHPVQATYLMAAHLNGAVGRFIATNFDRTRARTASFKGGDVMAIRETGAYWRLRQCIDDLGMPYEFFFDKAFAWYARAGWRRAPRPGHMTGNLELHLEAANAWENHSRVVLPWAAHRRYRVAAFVGAPDQLDYEAHVLKRIMQRPQPHYATHAALYLHDCLRIEAAIATLPSHTIEQAIKQANQNCQFC